MSKKTFFTAGPAGMYPLFEDFWKEAIALDIPSISHRSHQFRSIYQDTFEALKELLNLPEGVAVLFTGSATEIWERFLQNCVEQTSFHLVNGEFSKKFFEFSKLLQKEAIQQQAPFGEGFKASEVQVDYKAEVVAVTHNETSSGVMMPVEEIHLLKARNPHRLVVVDMVSSAPYPALDFAQIDSAFFSIQKAFGLPAGLGVWIVNEKCLTKAELLEKKGLITGTYHRLTNLWKFFEKFETPATPNVLGIFLLGKVVKSMLQKGIDTIRKEIDEKAQMLYQFLEESDAFDVFVQEEVFRSQTIIVAQTKKSASEIIQKLAAQNLVIGSGYKDYKESQLRIANFPNVSVEDVARLIHALKQI